MKVFVTGGSGFIGRELCASLLQRDCKVTVLSRKPDATRKLLGPMCDVVDAPDAVADSAYDVVINLAGLPIADRRWSAARKSALHESRVELTRQLVDAMGRGSRRPSLLLSASAIGYYGDQGERWVDEDTAPRAEYSHQLCAAWEQAAYGAQALGIRVCVLRLGLVIGPGGGFLGRLLPLFKLGLGGRLGDGQQWMSWVHRQDVLRMMHYLIDHETLQGAFNASSPRPVRNSEFTRALARELSRPAAVPVPAAALQLAMGEMSGLLLTGQRVAPARLLDAGFEFRFEQLEDALGETLGGE